VETSDSTTVLSDGTSDELTHELNALRERISRLEADRKSPQAPKPAAKSTYPNFKITGFTQLDSAIYSQSPENRRIVGDAQDGTGFRRARVAVKGDVAEATSYQVEMDFATAGRPSFFDCYVEQKNVPEFGTVKIGQFCQPFSVDALTGFRNLTFLERSLPFLALVPFRRVGIQSANLSDDEMTAFTGSIYRSGGFNNAPLGDDRFATDFGDIGGYAFSGRLTHLLMYEDDACLWHIGGAYNYSVLGANDAMGSGLTGNAGSPRPFYQTRTSPEFGSLGYSELGGGFGNAVNGTPSFVDTGRYEADNFHLGGLETVYQNGPLGITAEYMATTVNSVVGPVFYHGAYGQIAYRLTGEPRVYGKQTGTLGKLVPFRDFIPLNKDGVAGRGAWEIAARWSIIDLRNPNKLDGHYYNAATNSFTGTSKAGNGTLQDTTLGITWFLNTHTKIQGNWIHAMLDNSARGWSQADLFVSRVQVDF
jgi:phosphate-selective porin OprO/OprP